MNSAKLIWMTPRAEELIAYMARVSSDNQENPDYERLIAYLIKHNHWSPFEMVNFCVEINTSRAITGQIVRHRSFSFQEFSQRYQAVPDIVDFELRLQGKTNRQVGEGKLPDDKQALLNDLIRFHKAKTEELYELLLENGVAKECARMVLPMASHSKLYMNGTVRSWIHYLNIRCEDHAQKEHRDIAKQIKNEIFIPNFPITAKALGWQT